MKILANLNLDGNQLENVVIDLIAGDHGSPANGQVWYNTSTGKFRIRQSGSTRNLSDAELLNGQAASHYLDRTNHTGTQSADTLTDGTTNKAYTATEKTKLAGIATGATANSSDATLLARANHTGTQAASTISDFDSAVDARVNTRIATLDVMVYKGAIDASGNPNYPAANAGDTYRISVAGKVGGGSGTVVEAGDLIICHVDASAGGTQASVGADWDVIQINIDGAVTLTGTQTLTNKTLTSPVINNPTGIDTDDVTEAGNLYHTTERVQDTVAAQFAAGSHTGITVTYDDADGSLDLAVTATGTVGKYSALIGDGSATSITINQSTHGRAANSQNSVDVYDASTGEKVYPDITVAPASGNVTLAFATAPATNAYRVLILG